MNRRSRFDETAQLLRIVTAVAVVAALYVGRTVFIPLALALLLSLLLGPVLTLLGAIRVPRMLAILLVVVALCGLAAMIGWKAFGQFTDLTVQLPVYKKTLEQKIHLLGGLRASKFDRVSNAVNDLEKEVAKTIPGSLGQDHLGKAVVLGSSSDRPIAVEVIPGSNRLENIVGPLAAAGMVAIFTIFILMGREDLRNRFIHVTSRGRLTLVTQAMDEAATRIQRYLLLQSVVNVGYGVVIGTSLYFIGIPNAWLWGILAAILRFLPYVGPPASAFMPVYCRWQCFPVGDTHW